jgi:hypothetical protein
MSVRSPPKILAHHPAPAPGSGGTAAAGRAQKHRCARRCQTHSRAPPRQEVGEAGQVDDNPRRLGALPVRVSVDLKPGGGRREGHSGSGLLRSGDLGILHFGGWLPPETTAPAYSAPGTHPAWRRTRQPGPVSDLTSPPPGSGSPRSKYRAGRPGRPAEERVSRARWRHNPGEPNSSSGPPTADAAPVGRSPRRSGRPPRGLSARRWMG